ncbi:MAG: hypothetical protein ACYS8Z_01875 [Planctomycetota bacterium]|jgi:hypothetical protein
MKKKHKVLVSLVFVALVVAAALITRGIYFRRPYAQDKKWLSFAREHGFLNSPDHAIDHYAKAIQNLKEWGIDVQFVKEHHIGDKYATISAVDWDGFMKLVTKGAKAEKLGIRIETPKALTIDVEMYAPDAKKVELTDFILLAKAIAQLAEIQLTQEHDVDAAILLGYVNLTLGVQLSAYDVDFIHMCGISCKSSALDTLEECAKVSDDEDLIESVLQMRKRCHEEFETVKNMPPSLPSFWDFIR